MPVNAQTIQTARDSGYNDSQIRDYIVNSPEYTQAKQAGYGDNEIFSHLGFAGAKKYDVQGKPDASAAETERMRKEFIQKEGTLGTQLRNIPASEYLKEPLRFATETALMPINALGRGLKSAASLVQGGGEAIRTGDIDAGMRKYQEKQSEFRPVESPMETSAPGKLIGTGFKKATDYASQLTGRPDIVEPVAQGAMDIGALVGLRAAAPGAKALLTQGGKSLVEGAGNTARNALLSAGERVGVTPEKLYASSLKQSTTIPMEQRAANIKAGLDGGYIPNKKGLDRLYDDINGINDSIGAAINESAQGGKMIPVENIIGRLDDVKQRAIDSFGDNKTVLSKIDEFADSLREHPAVVDGQIPVDIAQKMKVNTYKQLKNAYGELKGFEVEAKKAMARGAKEEIVNQIPELADLNAKDSTLINLEKVLYKAVNRIENRDLVGIGIPIKAGVGAMHGSAGALAGLIAGLIDMPAIKAHIAVALQKAKGKTYNPRQIQPIIEKIKSKLLATATIAETQQGDSNAANQVNE